MTQYLWSEWRGEYVKHSSEHEGCFLCHAVEREPSPDTLVVYRDDSVVVLLNRYPYNPGHLLVCPVKHIGTIPEVEPNDLAYLFNVVRRVVKLAEPLFRAHGWNIGINQGRAAGAGVPGHLHVHVVPRWDGDSNFMAVVADVRVVSQRLESLWAELRAEFERIPSS